MTGEKPLRLGTRASALARWQANWVAQQLQRRGVPVQTVLITTQGDSRSGPIGTLGTQGVFTKEIQAALLADQIDLAVHSLKDLPTQPVPGLTLAAVPARESPSDVLVSHVADRFGALPANARVGTGSARRRAQLWHRRPELSILGIRGNVDTRLKQLDRQDFDAIILAEAGLQRLGLAHRITQVLPSDWMLPAVGQGALGLETRESDDRTRARVRSLDDRLTRQCVLSERALLGALGGGCSAPVAAWGREEDGKLVLDAAVLSPDGSRRLHRRGSDSPENARSLGRDVADQLLALGAAELLALSR